MPTVGVLACVLQAAGLSVPVPLRTKRRSHGGGERAMIGSGSFGAHTLALALAALCGLGVGRSAALQAPTQRLQLKIDRATLRVGATARLTVEFLDGNFQPVANDRDRVVEFAQVPSGPGQSGAVTLSASHVSIPRGARSDTTVTLQAGSPGKLLIRATTSDLAPAQTLVVIALQGSSLINVRPSFWFAAYQQDVTIEINPRGAKGIPANGMSRAQFWVTLNRPLKPGQRRHIIVKSFPGVEVLYHGEKRVGVAQITIVDTTQLSEELDISSTAPGKVQLVTWVAPNGSTDTVEIQFEPPRPARVIFERGQDTIPLRQREVLLTIRLADQDRVAVSQLDRTWRLRLSSPTDPGVTAFDPETLTLSSRPVGRSVLYLKGSPAANDIRLLAMDLDGTLDPGERTITVTGLEPPEYMLILLAGLGGIFGGLARAFYQGQVSRLLPSWSAGYLHLGLLGNAPFSFLFGYVLFQATALGLLVGFERPPAIAGTHAFAFFFGVLGGFGSIAVLDSLLDRIFPGRKTGEYERQRPSGSAGGGPSA